jgi:hypothetical protein
MATLFNTKIKDTYQSLLKLEDNTILTTTTKNITDGLGNASPLYMSTTRVGVGTNAPSVAFEVRSPNQTDVIRFKSQYAQYGYLWTGNTQVGLGSSSFGDGAGTHIVLNNIGAWIGAAGADMATAKLQVKGSGSTSATTSFLVQNSSANTLLQVLDNGLVYVGSSLTGLSFSGSNTQIFNNGGGAGNISFAMGGVSYLNIYQPINNGGGFTSGTLNTITTPFTYTNTSGAVSYNLLSISPGINNTGTYTGTIRGIYYNPSLTSLVGTTHIALETVTGNVLLGTTSGNVGIGTSSPTSKVAIVQGTLGSFSGSNISALLVDITQSNNLSPSAIVPFGVNILGTYTDLNTANNTVYQPFFNINTLINSPNSGLASPARLLTNISPSINSIGRDINNGTTILNIASSFTARHINGITGIYYNPTFTLTGSLTNHRAIETVSGNVILGSSSGNVLIGTTTDSGFKLDVSGTARFSGAVTAGINNGIFADIILDYNGGTRRIRPGGNSLALTDSLGNRAFQINAGGGNPQIALEHDGVNFVRGLVSLQYTMGSTQQMVLTASNYVGHLTPFFDIKATGYANSKNTDLRLYTDNTTSGTYGNIIIGHNGTNATGNVGVGEASPTARLQVKGSGSTSATTSLLVQNSLSRTMLQVIDDGRTVVNGDFYVTSPSFTGQLFIQCIGNSQQRIQGAYGENITFGTGGNTMSLNATEVYVSNGFYGPAHGLTTGGAIFGQLTSPVASAQVEIRSTTKGFLPSRMTTTQKNAIASPAEGLMVYDSTLKRPCFFDGTSWVTM